MIYLLVMTSLILSGCAHTSKNNVVNLPAESYQWLESIEGNKALSWVKAQNKKTLSELEKDPNYKTFYKAALNILNNKDRIPYGSIRGGYVYNFWQDEHSIRGLWRRTTLSDYKNHQPNWDILLDIDKLAAAENEPWVFKGVNCYSQTPDMCLINLSRGGKDAHVTREFDIPTKSFVQAGFILNEAKSDVEWIDEDNLMVATDYGQGTPTNAPLAYS